MLFSCQPRHCEPAKQSGCTNLLPIASFLAMTVDTSLLSDKGIEKNKNDKQISVKSEKQSISVKKMFIPHPNPRFFTIFVATYS